LKVQLVCALGSELSTIFNIKNYYKESNKMSEDR